MEYIKNIKGHPQVFGMPFISEGKNGNYKRIMSGPLDENPDNWERSRRYEIKSSPGEFRSKKFQAPCLFYYELNEKSFIAN